MPNLGMKYYNLFLFYRKRGDKQAWGYNVRYLLRHTHLRVPEFKLGCLSREDNIIIPLFHTNILWEYGTNISSR